MQLTKRFLITSTIVLSAILTSGAKLHAQIQPENPAQAEACRLGLYNPFVGAWSDNLSITNIGPSASLIVLNQGGTLTETDAIDLNDPTTVHSPGYGAWKALDCQHYKVTINKILYNLTSKQSETTILVGNALLSDDGNSWTATLNQQFFNQDGTVVFTDIVTASAKRIVAGSAE